MPHIWIYFLIVLLSFCDSTFADYCYESYYSYLYGGYRTRTVHCSFGCCGPAYDEYCCVSNAGFIVGLVFAGIFAISLITAMVCCLIKKKTSSGRMIRPSGTSTTQHTGGATSNVFIVPSAPGPPAYSSTAYSTNYNPYGGYGMGPGAPMPPAYSQTGPPPPAYGTHPAYPPSTAAGSAVYPPQGYPPQQAAYPPSTSTGAAPYPPQQYQLYGNGNMK